MGDVEGMWRGCGEDVERMWRGCGEDVDVVVVARWG
jgi:hypothetical protein